MTPPDPHYGGSEPYGPGRGSPYYPEDPGQTRHYPAAEHESERRAERAEAEREAERKRAERERKRIMAARVAITIIQVACYLFAVVLAVHIVLVIGEANEGNDFYQFIDSWASAVSLGFEDLFVPENLKFRTLLNEGLAAIVWIIIGIVLSTLVRRFVMPVPSSRRTW